jgi:DNA-directed RNA polymerase specialized sigma24 family protein
MKAICKPCVSRVIRVRRSSVTAGSGMQEKVRELVDRYVCREANRDLLTQVADSLVAQYQSQLEDTILGIIRVEFVRIIKGNSRERATLDHLPDPKSVVRPSAAGFDLNQILTKLSPEEKDLCIEILIHGNSCANYAEIRGICAKKVTRDVAKLKERIKCMIS